MRRIIAAALFLLSAMIASLTFAGPLPDNTVTVWYQPVSSFQKWHDRGVTTILGYESENGTVSKQQWKAALKAAGLNGIVQSTALDLSDNNDKAIVGVMVAPDEPDGGGNVSPGGMLDRSLAIRAVTSLPLVINFDGNRVPYRSLADYVAYCACADVVCVDLYPFNFGCQTIQSATVSINGVIAKVKQAANGRPIYVIAECSNQDLGKQPWTQANDASGTPLSPKMRGPTVQEIVLEWVAFKRNGAAGVWWFPDMIGLGWEGFDGVQPDASGALTALNLPQK